MSRIWAYLSPGALVLGLVSGCSHLGLKETYDTRLQLVEFSGCKSMVTLEQIEKNLFHDGFVREPVHEEHPLALELREAHIANAPRFINYTKTDLAPGGETIENRYRVASCEQVNGELYLIVVRHERDPEARFLGARFTDALDAAVKTTGCSWRPLGAPSAQHFYKDSTEAGMLEHARRGLCREIASAR